MKNIVYALTLAILIGNQFCYSKPKIDPEGEHLASLYDSANYAFSRNGYQGKTLPYVRSAISLWEKNTGPKTDSLSKLFLPEFRYAFALAAYKSVDSIKGPPSTNKSFEKAFRTAYASICSLNVLDSITSCVRCVRYGLTLSNYLPALQLARDLSISDTASFGTTKRKLLLTIATSNTSLRSFLSNTSPSTFILDSLYKASRLAEQGFWLEGKKTYLNATRIYADSPIKSNTTNIDSLIKYLSFLRANPDSSTYITGDIGSSFSSGRHRFTAGLAKGIEDAVEILSVSIQYVIPFIVALILMWLIMCLIRVFGGGKRIEFGDENVTNNGNDANIKTLKALIESELNSISQGPTHSYLHLAAGTSINMPTTLTAVLPPPLKVFQAIVNFIGTFPIFRGNRMSLCIHEKTNRGVGMTVVISRNWPRRNMSATFWQNDYMPILESDKSISNEICVVFSKVLAAWILFNLYKKDCKKHPPIGTHNWKSYAYFLVGVHTYLESTIDEARRLFTFAVNEDENNFGAWYNLGYLYLQDAVERQSNYQLATAALQKALKLSMKSPTSLFVHKKIPKEKIFYNALFQLMAIPYYEKSQTANSKMYLDDQVKATINKFKFLTKEFNAKDHRIVDIDLQQSIKECSNAIRCIEKSSCCINCMVKLKLSTPRKAYNSACCISENLNTINEAITSLKDISDKIKEQSPFNDQNEEISFVNQNKDKANQMVKILSNSDHNRVTPELNKFLEAHKKWVGDSPDSIGFSNAIDLLEVSINPGNLCSTAFDYLDFALSMRGGITRWARIDPSLRNLKNCSLDRFNELIDKHSKPGAGIVTDPTVAKNQ